MRPVPPALLARALARSFRWWIVAAAALGLVVILVALGANRPADPSLLAAGPTLTTGPDGSIAFVEGRIALGDNCRKVLVADTPEKRARGLMGFAAVPAEGMLFVNQHDTHDDLTMSKVQFPLDAGFFDARGHRVGTIAMNPCPDVIDRCPRYRAPHEYRYMLETKRGSLSGGDLGACTE